MKSRAAKETAKKWPCLSAVFTCSGVTPVSTLPWWRSCRACLLPHHICHSVPHQEDPGRKSVSRPSRDIPQVFLRRYSGIPPAVPVACPTASPMAATTESAPHINKDAQKKKKHWQVLNYVDKEEEPWKQQKKQKETMDAKLSVDLKQSKKGISCDRQCIYILYNSLHTVLQPRTPRGFVLLLFPDIYSRTWWSGEITATTPTPTDSNCLLLAALFSIWLLNPDGHRSITTKSPSRQPVICIS